VRKNYRYSARRMGEVLEITADEAYRFGLTTILAIDEAPDEIQGRRNAARAKEKRMRREAAGAKPHATSERRAEPWKELGISRRTYYRRKQAGNSRGTNSAHFHSIGMLSLQRAPPMLGGSTPPPSLSTSRRMAEGIH